MLQQTATFSAALAPWLFQAAQAQAAVEETDAFMADPGLTQQVIQTLQQEANKASTLVTDSHRQEYQETGVVQIPNVLSQQWIQMLKDGCEVAQDEAGPYAEYLQKPTDSGIFFTDLELARRIPLFAAFSLYGPAAAVAGSVLESNEIRYLYDQLFVKEKGVSTMTPWHQDGGYWQVQGQQIASVFCCLDPVPANEGLVFVTGSHRWKHLYNPQRFADGTQYRGTKLPPMPNISGMIDNQEVSTRTFHLNPGDVLVFSARTVHGGPGNWGRALSTRWVGDDATFWDRPGEGAVPTMDVALKNGEPLADNPAAFPTSWKRQDKLHGTS